ncbi:hypothetical protein PANI_CDS0112 [Maribacter phage Panino]
MPKKMKNRYFIVNFTGITKEDTSRNGRMEYRTENGKFVNEITLIKVIEKGFNLDYVFISSITEIKESDFNDFTEGRENPPELQTGQDDGDFL